MDNPILYKLWLNLVCKGDVKLIDRLIWCFGSEEEIYKLSNITDARIKEFGKTDIRKFNRSLDKAGRLQEACRAKGITILTYGDELYPSQLRSIICPPRVLYARGNIRDYGNVLGITIVGTRKPTDYGLKMARKIAFDLAKKGVIVTSGLAEGIDGAAHMGALDAGAPTVAVLPNGVDNVFPKSHKNLCEHIIQDGMVISELVPGSRGDRFTFKDRNRIMAGLSQGVLVIEAGKRTGTRMTANHALANGRDVFALMGNVDSEMSEYPNALAVEGQRPIRNAEDILAKYEAEYAHVLVKRHASEFKQNADAPKKTALEDTKLFPQLNNNERSIVKYLYDTGKAHIDQVAAGTGIAAEDLNEIIMILQMKDIVGQSAGNMYELGEIE